ncbi:DVUA0089 family protein [Sorangium sp. So ce1151]|uniref:DVUA0089 family protein n=1 Tax=Sorangium sp. So ce1151 TaxID=3133332 RepID=UPI003F60FA43
MIFPPRTALPLLFGLAAPALLGCELLVTVDRSKIDDPPVPGAHGGGGDGGGGAVGGGGSSGDGGGGGSGGDGGAPGAECGDGAIAAPAEACDDGNREAGDGCDPGCAIEPGFACAGAPSTCTAGCGDGALGGREACDDGGDEDGDCCSRACQVEPGCEVEPNDDFASANDAFAVAPDGQIRAFIDPEADVDVFSVTVPDGAVGRLRAQTLDGPLGTTCSSLGVDTYVTIFDGALATIEAHDDIADDNYCSYLVLDKLSAGEYFVSVQVSPAAEPAAFDYTLSLTLDTAVCGDGALEDPELCDDGNTTGGDGCSAACELDTPLPEVEPNSTAAEADERGALRPNELVSGAIEPLGDVDVFAFEVPRLAEIQLATFSPGSLSDCHQGVDTFIQLLDVDGETALASDDDSGPEACSLIDASIAPWATQLRPGTYYVTVEEFSNDATIPGYDLLVVFTALCGDGVVEGGEACDGGEQCSPDCARIASCGDGAVDDPETCDDGGTEGGDGCSAACELEGTLPEVEPNDALDQATAGQATAPGALFSASISPAGDVDYFAVDVAGVADLEVETFDASGPTSCRDVDTVIQLLAPDGAVIGEDDDGGEERCSLVQAAIAAPGIYYVRVEEYGGSAIAGYTLRARTTTLCGDGVVEGHEECDGGAGCGAACQRVPSCGDGFIDHPERCDDGNAEGGDGCDAACQLEGVTAEIEPNSTPAEADANGALGPGALVSGALDPEGDVDDVFALRLATVSDLRLETFDSSGPEQCAEGVDTALSLLATDGATLLASDDDGGANACSLIDPASPGGAAARHLAPGTYYVHVRGFPELPAARYTLRISLDASCGNGVREGAEECDGGARCTPGCDRLPVCGDGFVDAPEGCDDGNVAGGDGCSAACQLEAATAEIEPNDTGAQAGASEIVISGDALVAASIAAGGDRDVFRVSLPVASVVRLEVLDGTAADCEGGIATTLRVLDAAGEPVATDEGLSDAEYAGGIGGCSALVVGLPAGDHDVEVAAREGGAAIPIYLLQAKILAPAGTAGVEEEPNGDIATANGPVGSDVFIAGARTTDDFDLYAVDLPEGRSIRAEIVEGGGGAETCESLDVDSRLSLLDGEGSLIADDDDSGRGSCSLLDGTGDVPRHPGAHALPAGTYFLRVRASSGARGSAALFDYRLAVTVR